MSEELIDAEFRRIMESNTGCAVILAGSDSDEDHIAKIAKALEGYEIPYRTRICSAHKQPKKLDAIIDAYNSVQGSVVFVAVAGGVDALSGTSSWSSFYPVVSCPPDHPNYSCINNPPGNSNSYIARPANVAKYIAQMFAGRNPRFRELLQEKNTKKIGSLDLADQELGEKYRSSS